MRPIAVTQVEALRQLKASERHARLQPLVELLDNYRDRHETCVKMGSGLPGKYVKVTGGVSIGVRNGLPAVLTGRTSSIATLRSNVWHSVHALSCCDIAAPHSSSTKLCRFAKHLNALYDAI